jgi:glycosyltransferase involved in cell wall biosynthesis
VRILYLADIRFPLERANGIQTMETCYALAARGHAVHLAVRPDTQRPARDPFAYYGLPPLDRLTIECASTGRGLVRRSQTGQRAAYLRFAISRALGAGFDVVFTRDLGVASLLVRIPRSMRPPIVYESHGYAPDVAAALPDLVVTAREPDARKLRRLARREARVWRDAEGYVTITSGLAEHLADRLGTRSRVAIVPDGTRYADQTYEMRIDAGARGFSDTDASAGNESPSHRPTELPNQGATELPSHRATEPRIPNSQAVASRPLVTYAGHLYPWKGVDILLEALVRLPEADGLIVGGHEREPDLGRLTDLARSLEIVDRVTFTGLVEPSAVPELLASATVLALPNPPSAISTKFTSPLKLFEYMAAGRAIVASDLPAIREVLTHNVDAILVKAGDPDALADGIRQVIEDPVLAGRLGQSAVENAAQYSWDRRAERLEGLFEQVIARR